MALTKVTKQTLYAIASTAADTVDEGSSVDASTWYEAEVRVRMGRATGTVFTVAPKGELQASSVASPNANDWVTVATFQPAVGASIGSQAVSGTEAAGQTVVTLAAGTNFAAGDFVFFHNTTLANSEFCKVQSVSGADLTLSEGLVNAQTGATCRDQAEQWSHWINLRSIQRLRFVVNNAGSGQAVIYEVDLGAVTALV